MYIDFHAHILPAADHGCADTAMALWQLREAKNAAVSTVVATPHFYPAKEALGAFLARRARCYEALMRARSDDLPAVRLGAEVHLCEGMEELEGLDALCIAGTKTLLLEMPLRAFSARMIETVYEIKRTRGLTPLMAHIDRYPPQDVAQLLALGVPCQINTDSVCRLSLRRRCRDWVRDGHVAAIGSDIHRNDDAYSRFSRALRLLGADAVDEIQRASRALLAE